MDVGVLTRRETNGNGRPSPHMLGFRHVAETGEMRSIENPVWFRGYGGETRGVWHAGGMMIGVVRSQESPEPQSAPSASHEEAAETLVQVAP